MHRLHAAAWLLLPVVAGFVATPRVAPASTWLPPAVRARGGGGAATSRVVTMMGRRGTLRPKDSESKRQGRVAQLVRNELADIVRKGKNVKAVQGKPLDPRLCEKAREDALRFSFARVVVEPPPRVRVAAAPRRGRRGPRPRAASRPSHPSAPVSAALPSRQSSATTEAASGVAGSSSSSPPSSFSARGFPVHLLVLFFYVRWTTPTRAR